jgi:hypothetical protein
VPQGLRHGSSSGSASFPPPASARGVPPHAPVQSQPHPVTGSREEEAEGQEMREVAQDQVTVLARERDRLLRTINGDSSASARDPVHQSGAPEGDEWQPPA